MTLKIGLSVDPAMPRFLELAQEAERLGVDSAWVAEYWAYDAFTPLAAIAAVTDRLRLATGIAQLGARTPAMLAMTAQGVQMLSGGRLILGIGASGPQVMEGWHGVPFDRPVQRTRETIEIVRMIAAGERLTYDGAVHQLPLPGGAGKAIRSRAETAPIPVYVAALGPANLHLTGELADGWIGNSFFPATADAFFDPIREGAAEAGRSLELTSDDPAAIAAAGRRHADGYAFTFGAMGSATKNFYNDAFARQGFGDDVAEVQRLWAEGDREGAAARVPVEIGLGTNLVGPPELIHDRLVDYERSGVTTLRIGVDGSFDATTTGFDAPTWQKTACILCECNCGVEIRLGPDGHTFDRVRGDKDHPASQGYTCEKALRLDHYQNGRGDRVLNPLRRRADGTPRSGTSPSVSAGYVTNSVATRSCTTAAAARGTISVGPTARRCTRGSAAGSAAAPSARRRAARSGSTARCSATPCGASSTSARWRSSSARTRG